MKNKKSATHIVVVLAVILLLLIAVIVIVIIKLRPDVDQEYDSFVGDTIHIDAKKTDDSWYGGSILDSNYIRVEYNNDIGDIPEQLADDYVFYPDDTKLYVYAWHIAESLGYTNISKTDAKPQHVYEDSECVMLCCDGNLVSFNFVSDSVCYYTIESDNEHDESNITEYTAQTEVVGNSKYFLIGDSRIVGLNQVTDISSEDKYDVLAEVGKGYNWLLEQELPSDRIIVSFLGVNDLGNVQKYISYYNSILEQGYKLILITVGPVDENIEAQFGYSVLNEDINAFNEDISNEVNCEVLDLNTYLKSIGYSTVDGVHYTQETYKTIYDFVIDNLK